MARAAEKDLRRTACAIEAVHKARGEIFAQRQERARLDRLAQAVRVFERLPLEPALVPSAGKRGRRASGFADAPFAANPASIGHRA